MNKSEEDQVNENEMDDLEKGKCIEFYSQSYASFYNTTMEKDKSILTVSAGGIGFLITILTISKEINVVEYILFLFAALSFIVAIFTIIHIFGKNADYIISLTTESDDCDEKDNKLKTFDKVATCAFAIAIASSVILGATLTFKNIKNEVVIMSKKNESSQPLQKINESATGASSIKRSFCGAAKLKPNASTQSTGTSSSAQTSTNTNTTNTPSTGKKDR